ncbi:MAG: RNA polymerase sigma factor (sigma-70 family) [Rhodothermales bacterium]|jgi:RNA polymerase sigma factor (sigma-70 family)
MTVIRHQHRVFGYALRLLGDRDLAKDAVQDSMLRMWKHKETVEMDGAISWLLRVTHNACIDMLRRRKLENRLFEGNADTERLGTAEWSPAKVAESKDLMGHLQQAIDQLKEPYRSIVILREVEDFQYDEICGALDLPMSTVKVYLHRGRKMLRKTLGEVLHIENA